MAKSDVKALECMSEALDNEEAEQTMQERMAYLRQRGVEIETVEDRKQAAAKKAAQSSLNAKLNSTAASNEGRTFMYVRLPAADDEVPRQCKACVHRDSRGDGDQLKALLASKFVAGKVDKNSLKHSRHVSMLKSAGTKFEAALSPEAVEKLGGSAEAFRLSASSGSDPADTIYLYLDEVGALKHLPLNKRAANLAQRCGFGAGVPFHGDMYIGRVRSSRGRSWNINFNLEELAPDSEWLRMAASRNLETQRSEGRVGGVAAEDLLDVATHKTDDGYSWEQSEPGMVEISVPLPAGTRGKACSVKIMTKKVTVKVSTTPPISLSLALFAKVCPDGSTWTIDDGNLCISLEKSSEGVTWSQLVA